MHIAGRILFDSLERHCNAAKRYSSADNDFIGLGNFAAAPHTSAPKVLLSSSDPTVINVDLDGKSYGKSQRWMKPEQNRGYFSGFQRYTKSLPESGKSLGESTLVTIVKRLLIDRYMENDAPMSYFSLDSPLGKILIGYPGNESVSFINK